MSELSLPNTRGARIHTKGSQGEVKNHYVTFGLGKEAFAVEIAFVKEILQFHDLTEVPLLPTWVRGVINLRGAMVPVLDLAVRFGRPPTEVVRRTCIVILEVPQAGKVMAIGAIVDSVTEVLELVPTDIEPAPALGTDPRSVFISGIAKVRGRFVILLDAARILSNEEAFLLIQETPTEATGT